MAMCNKCKRKGLIWGRYNGKWSLRNHDHTRHFCSKRRLTYQRRKFMRPIAEIRKLVESKAWVSYANNQPNVGDIIRHSADTSRKDWIGLVTAVGSESSMGHDTMVLWLFASDFNGKITKSIEGDTTQGYRSTWFLRDMRLLDRKVYPENKKEKEPLDFNMGWEGLISNCVDLLFQTTPTEEEESGRYIVWAPTGVRNPKKVITGYRYEAEKVASCMAKRHNAVFYVAKLITVASPETRIEVKVEPLDVEG